MRGCRSAEQGDDDQQTVARMRLAFLRDVTGIELLPPELALETLAFFRTQHVADGVWSWLASDGEGACAGAVSLLVRPVPPHPFHPGAREGYVVNMYVEPPARRAGVGRLLLDALLDDARAAGLRRVTLHASDDGRPLYASAGFATDADWMQLKLTS